LGRLLGRSLLGQGRTQCRLGHLASRPGTGHPFLVGRRTGAGQGARSHAHDEIDEINQFVAACPRLTCAARNDLALHLDAYKKTADRQLQV
jgi:hypothetical protein